MTHLGNKTGQQRAIESARDLLKLPSQIRNIVISRSDLEALVNAADRPPVGRLRAFSAYLEEADLKSADAVYNVIEELHAIAYEESVRADELQKMRPTPLPRVAHIGYDPCDPESGMSDAGGIDGRFAGEVKGL